MGRWKDGKMESRTEFEAVLHMLAMNDEVGKIEDFSIVQEVRPASGCPQPLPFFSTPI